MDNRKKAQSTGLFELRRSIAIAMLIAFLAASLNVHVIYAETPEEDSDIQTENAEDTGTVEYMEIYISSEDGCINAAWNHIEDAEYYIATIDEGYELEIDAPEDENFCRAKFEDADIDTTHCIIAWAYNADDELIAEGYAEDIVPYGRNRLSDGQIKANGLGLNLRTILGESRTGYSVVQGGCTDGTCAYYLMVSPYNQNGRILKLRVGDNAVIARSKVITINHGNGMAIDVKRNRLVIIGREDWRNKITTVDADTLSDVAYTYADYSNEGRWQTTCDNGLSAISYIERYDCYIALQRKTHDLLVLDPDFRVIGLIGTKITAKYPGMYQAIDADERYVYLLLSYYSDKQPYNIILTLDWNSENLLPRLGDEDYVAGSWNCNNDKSGEPDAAIIVKTPYEAENIYHIEQGDGTSRFYLSEYHKNQKTKYVTKKKKYKVKWKKVKKKIKKKWKIVKKRVKWKKVNGKWKYKTKKVWKYKYKWKKVWKYKKKTKKIKVKSGTYYNRDNYIYDLGII